MRDRAIVTVEGKQENAPKLLMSNNSKTLPDRVVYNGQ